MCRTSFFRKSAELCQRLDNRDAVFGREKLVVSSERQDVPLFMLADVGDGKLSKKKCWLDLERAADRV